jgi:hypothetical protein
VEPDRPRPRTWGGAAAWVAVIAIGQSLLFLAVLLFFCLAASAEPAPKEFVPELQMSTYGPRLSRDPFVSRVVAQMAPEVKVLPGMPIVFQLQGILYQDGNPSALVNGQLLTKNKLTKITSDGKTVEVRAVEITRDRVVLESGGQRVELSMNAKPSVKGDQP